LTKTAAATMAPDTTFNTNAMFPANGAMSTGQGQASVLYLEEGPTQPGCPTMATGCTATMRAANAGVFFAFAPLTVNPNVFAFDETTGLPVWTAHVTNGGTGGGDGIRGTPVIDRASRRVFVVTGNFPHIVHALSVDNGVEVTTGGWPVTLSKSTLSYTNPATATKSVFDSVVENQHGASLLLNNILYIPFGGEDGDGGSYLGWIVAIDITKPTSFAGWATQSAKSGIWGAGGLASDGTYVFAVTGNAPTTAVPPRNASDSEEVVRVSGLAQFSRDANSIFVPTECDGWDGGDLDFGASTAAVVPLPAGSTPPSLLVAPAKAGVVYILNGANLSSGMYPTPGGQLAEVTVASTTGESIYTSPTVYTSASGLHVAIEAGVGPFNCPTGAPTSKAMIMSLLLQPGKAPPVWPTKAAWCAAVAGGDKLNYPPISTTTDGASANAMVWFVNGAQLTAVDGDTGNVLVTTKGAPCNMVPSMSYPIAAKNRIVVYALGHLCSWSPNGQ
jgi:hypothetical protein